MADLKNRVLLAGGSGLVGQRLSQILIGKGYHVNILTRSAAQRKNTQNIRYFNWNINRQTIDLEALDVDFIVNLAGAGIADKRWTATRKRDILESRTASTKLLADSLAAKTKQNIIHYIGASAIGIYGDSEKKLLTEESISSGSDFMVQVCKQWESAHLMLKEQVKHLSILRIGIVLSTKGGALKEILKPLKMGRIAAHFGDGSMIYSWIHIDDLCNMLISLMESQIKAGTYNAVSPHPVSNKKLIETILDATGLKAIKLPAPSFAMKLILGEMSNTILNSTSVSSALIQEAGYNFSYPDLNKALEDLFASQK